jgi:sugar lactone lactonase YvrE
MTRRTAAVVALITLLALVYPSGAGADPIQSYPATIALPDGFQPEGIATGPGAVAYFGSRVDGDIFRVDLATGSGRVFSQGPGTPSLGMKTDGHGLLYVAGGVGGGGRVVDTRTGAVRTSYRFATGDSFVNDVVLTPRTAWFTDSSNPVLYGVSRSRRGVVRLPLTGDFEQAPGEINANGITRTPDGRALLVVQSNTGKLFRVEPATGYARTVDLGGYSLTRGDGMLLDGRTLYVVRNRLNTIAVLRLNRSGLRGHLAGTVTDPRFDVPTTVARFRHRLYLPNARFTTPPTPETTYTAVAVRR